MPTSAYEKSMLIWHASPSAAAAAGAAGGWVLLLLSLVRGPLGAGYFFCCRCCGGRWELGAPSAAAGAAGAESLGHGQLSLNAKNFLQ
ncbi:MAG: hypothetical protein HFF84_00720 [Oscillibacter sp.]|nr:hypothetical protein [Oscillibacter sp.]